MNRTQRKTPMAARWSFGLVAALLCMLAAGPAFAQDAQAQQQNSGVTDSRTTGSWVVRCYRVGGEACDLAQATFTRDRNLRIASIIIGYIPKSNQIIGRFIVPLGVAFAPGLSIEIGSFRAASLKFRRCERDGCYIEGVLPQAMLDAMQAQGTGKGAMGFVLIDGRKVQIPIVLDGFSDGLALLKQWTVEKTGGGGKAAKG